VPSEGGQRIVCAYCGSTLVRRGEVEASTTPGWGVHYKTITCVDQQGIGIEAFRMLIPAGWEFEGGVHWLLNNPVMPAVVACRGLPRLQPPRRGSLRDLPQYLLLLDQ